MPRKISVTKDSITEAALEIVRTQGPDSLNARALAKALGCSTQPIFSNFSGMEDVTTAVLGRSLDIYNDYVRKEFGRNEGFPPYKTNGMAYIRFAIEEKNLFKLLFMRDRSNDADHVEDKTFVEVLPLIMKATGFSEEQAALFHLEMWTCVHGIASLAATSYYTFDTDLASKVLTDTYQGLLSRFSSQQMEANDEKRH